MSDETKVAFALRDGTEFDAGTVVYDDGKTLDVAGLLEEGDGVIVVDEDSKEQIALRSYPPLKSVAVPKSGKAVKAHAARSGAEDDDSNEKRED